MIKKIALALMIGALSNSAFAIKALEDLRVEAETKDGWRLAKNDRRHNIKAYVKNEDGKSIRSFKVEALFDYPIDVVAGAVIGWGIAYILHRVTTHVEVADQSKTS